MESVDGFAGPGVRGKHSRSGIAATIGLAAFMATSAAAFDKNAGAKHSQPESAPLDRPVQYYLKRGLLPRHTPPGGAELATGPAAVSAQRSSATLSFASPATLPVDLSAETSVTNVRILMQNAGQVDLVDPWVTVDGRRNWFDAASIAKRAVGEETDPEMRAFRVWDFLGRNRYHWYPAETGKEMHSPVKLLNVYGYGFCDDSASVLEALWKAAGFAQARCWGIVYHVVPEVFYKGDWHVLDPDYHLFYPDWNGQGALSVSRLADDFELAKLRSFDLASGYAARDKHKQQQNQWETSSTMAMILRPGESLERCHYNWGKYHDIANRKEPPLYGNGRQIWSPDLTSSSTAARGFTRLTNVRLDKGLRPDVGAAAASAGFKMTSPYVFVGGTVSASVSVPSAGDTLVFEARRSKGQWKVVETVKGPFHGRREMALSPVIAPLKNSACYEFEVRMTMTSKPGSAGMTIGNLTAVGEIQCAPWSLPALLPNRINQVKANFAGAPGAALQVHMDWIESRDPGVLAAPARPVAPAHQATVAMGPVELRWESSVPEGQEIWRSVVVSTDPEGYRPVSPVSKVRKVMPNRWRIPDGLLAPGQTYYWHVQEQDEMAEWSPSWKFTMAE